MHICELMKEDLTFQGMFVIEHLKPERVLDYIGAVLSQWEPLGVMDTRNDTEFDVLEYVFKLLNHGETHN